MPEPARARASINPEGFCRCYSTKTACVNAILAKNMLTTIINRRERPHNAQISEKSAGRRVIRLRDVLTSSIEKWL